MKRLVFHFLGLAFFGLCIFLALEKGRSLPAPESPAPNLPPSISTSDLGAGTISSVSLFANLRENFQDPLTRLLVQLILIVLAARLCGLVAAKTGQPAVIGEMIAGILLGPSLLGWAWPGMFQLVFSPASLPPLRLLSQIGVCLFMFVVGMELDVAEMKQQAGRVVIISQMSILFPYTLGVISSLFLFTTMAGPKTTFLVFALFVGISMSITAFPVLARILEERGLTRTSLGSTALLCAATNDVMAWIILALVVAIAKATSIASAVFSLGLIVIFVCAMLFWIKPRLPRWMGLAGSARATPGKSVTAGVVIFIFASALATDVMGIHALFGAFLAGVVMPAHGELRDFLKLRLENFSSVFLLPLFFAFTGLRTQVGLLNDAGGWLLCLVLILTATMGKLGGATITARLTGINWNDSFSLGALMNTRGLVELIALNIGYDLGIFSPRIFTMLIIMALVTTCMTGPLLSFSAYLRARSLAANPA
jgi:Kef-type K+ transport system membrane component KefB